MTKELSDFVVTSKLPINVVQSPTFLIGAFGQAVYDAYEEQRASRFENNPNLRLQNEGDVITGSTPFDTILINQIIRELKGNPRTPLLLDLSDPKVLEMTKGKHYADSQSLVLRSAADSLYSKNNPLAAYLAEHVDMARAEREPVLITGLRLELWTEYEEGYGLKTVPTEDATFHYDDRFLGKWNHYRFDKVDEFGLPVGLSKDEGSRTWYTRDDGLSRLYVGRNSGLGSYGDILDDSISDGRVVVLGGDNNGSGEGGRE
ncbi:MAG: hypothetical protein Q8P81_04255 [Nanoarchaeota archaeon]|nr:hypothetical protein [Nanoarchaeota archaeon]